MSEITKPLINILIRTSNRPAAFTRCMKSVQQQTYNKYRVIVAYDRAAALTYIPKDLMRLFVYSDNSQPYYYDRYCNDLKVMGTEGWFFFLDDDDVLASPTVLEELSQHLTDPYGAIICQFLRNGVPKPTDAYIKRKLVVEGKIGLPCLVLHSKYKEVGALDGEKAGDYRYIKHVTSIVPTKFVCLRLVSAGPRSHGKMEPVNNVSNISE